MLSLSVLCVLVISPAVPAPSKEAFPALFIVGYVPGEWWRVRASAEEGVAGSLPAGNRRACRRHTETLIETAFHKTGQRISKHSLSPGTALERHHFLLACFLQDVMKPKRDTRYIDDLTST